MTLKKTLNCIEMTLKLAQFCDDPKKNIHKIFIPPKNIHFSENPKKYWNSEFWTQKNRPSLRMCENIRVPPPPTLGCAHAYRQVQASPFGLNGSNTRMTMLIIIISNAIARERSGLVVECLTRDRGAVGSSLTHDTALCPWARTLILA